MPIQGVADSVPSSGVSAQATIQGHGCKFVLEVDGYEFPIPPDDYNDANWLVGRVELDAGLSGQFTGRLRVTPYAPDLINFRDQLQKLDRDLSGEATLTHLEDQFGVELRLTDGKGELKAFVREQVGTRLEVSRCEIDQSYTRRALTEFDALAESFPVRRL